jgi:hypothetical protein
MDQTSTLERIQVLEKKIKRLALDGVRLFDPMQGGKAFSHIGKHGDVTLIPQMGAEVECTVWPKDKFNVTDAQGLIQNYLDNAIGDHYEKGGRKSAKTRAVEEIPRHYPLNRGRPPGTEARPAGYMGRLYFDASPTCLEVVIKHDHPKYKGSPLMLCRLVDAAKNFIRVKGPTYGIGTVDFRAFPKPNAEQLAKAESDGDFRDATNKMISNALQFSTSFRDAEGRMDTALFPATSIQYKAGDHRVITGHEALSRWLHDSMFAMPEVYLASGFDMTEMARHERLNNSDRPMERAEPIRIKKKFRVENGTLSPTALTEVGVVCNLAAAWDAVKDRVEHNPDGTIKVDEIVDKGWRKKGSDPKESAGHITAVYGKDEFIDTGYKPSPKPKMPCSYDDMIAQAKSGHKLKRVLNTVSHGHLGDELMDALVERAELIQQLMAQGQWEYKQHGNKSRPAALIS